MFIPGILITILTFPGVIMHELAHKMFCNLAGLKVEKVCYFRLGNPSGFVVHEKPKRLRQAFLITAAPTVVNSLLAIAIFMAIRLIFGDMGSLFDSGLGFPALLWLGVSIGMHAFPSSGDADSLIHFVKESGLAWKLLCYPVAYLIKIANLLRIFWFDLVYAVILFFVAAALVESAASYAEAFQPAEVVEISDLLSSDYESFVGKNVIIDGYSRSASGFPQWSIGQLVMVLDRKEDIILVNPVDSSDGFDIENTPFIVRGRFSVYSYCLCERFNGEYWEQAGPTTDESFYPANDCQGDLVRMKYGYGEYRCNEDALFEVNYIQASEKMQYA